MLVLPRGHGSSALPRSSGRWLSRGLFLQARAAVGRNERRHRYHADDLRNGRRAGLLGGAVRPKDWVRGRMLLCRCVRPQQGSTAPKHPGYQLDLCRCSRRGPHPEHVPMARFPYANFGFGGVLIGVDRDAIIMIIFADLSVG